MLSARPVGVGRWQVKQTLLDYLQQDEARPATDKRYRTISLEHFQELCAAQEGRVSSAHELLRYLHHTGVVYYQEDLFHNQIILDQRWAIEAIYTIFHRQNTYHILKRLKGRFHSSDLHHLAWGEQFTAGEQRLFLSFMESCALCFCVDPLGTEDPEYIAPDLLPDGKEYADEIEVRQERHEVGVVYYRYRHPFLHQGVMRRFMVEVGRLFRDRALYWHGGLCIEPPQVQALAVVTCQRGVVGQPALGSITIEVRGRQRQSLLARIRNTFAQLSPNHEQMTQTLSLDGHHWFNVADILSTHDIGKVRSQPGTVLDTQQLLPYLFTESETSLRDEEPHLEEPSTMTRPAIYISYAWGDVHEHGASREDIVDRLYDSLSAYGYRLKRDKMDLGYKGLISEFMQKIGRGDCIVVVISDKYLKSPFCMYELWEIYRNARLDNSKLLERVVPVVLADAKIHEFEERLEYVWYWKEKSKGIERKIEKVGIDILSANGSFKEYEKYRLIAQYVDPLLTFVATINTQTPQKIAADNFAMLKQAIEARLQKLR